MQDYAKIAADQMKQVNSQVTGMMGKLTEMLLPQKTAVINIADQKDVTMNLTGKGESGMITLVFKNKQAAEQAFNTLVKHGTDSNKANILRRIYQSIRWW
jgi:hypothetical protein